MQSLNDTRLPRLSGNHSGQTASVGRPTVGRFGDGTGRKRATRTFQPHCRAHGRRGERARSGQKGPERPTRRPDVWCGNPGGSSTLWLRSSRWPLSPPDTNWHTCPALELGVPQLATHMAITGRRTSSPVSTPFFSTPLEDWAPRVLGTPACSPHCGVYRRQWAPAWWPPAAAITFRKSCP
jgi:hypothetical protein